MTTAHFNIGSNLGDRLALIGRAVALLEAHTGAVAAVSEPVMSAPWGYDSDCEYINVGVSIDTDLTPARLLAIAMEAEREIDPDGCHRTPSGSYADRLIDIDLICMGSTVSQADPELPHPRMHLREFVLEPLATMLPQWRHPLLGLTASELLEKLHTKTS